MVYQCVAFFKQFVVNTYIFVVLLFTTLAYFFTYSIICIFKYVNATISEIIFLSSKENILNITLLRLDVLKMY